MSEYKITFKVDGKEISQEQIREMEMSRYQIVFKELLDRGITPQRNGRKYQMNELEQVNLNDAKEILAETKENLGRTGIREIYAEDLKKGDAMWKSNTKAAIGLVLKKMTSGK